MMSAAAVDMYLLGKYGCIKVTCNLSFLLLYTSPFCFSICMSSPGQCTVGIWDYVECADIKDSFC